MPAALQHTGLSTGSAPPGVQFSLGLAHTLHLLLVGAAPSVCAAVGSPAILVALAAAQKPKRSLFLGSLCKTVLYTWMSFHHSLSLNWGLVPALEAKTKVKDLMRKPLVKSKAHFLGISSRDRESFEFFTDILGRSLVWCSPVGLVCSLPLRKLSVCLTLDNLCASGFLKSPLLLRVASCHEIQQQNPTGRNGMEWWLQQRPCALLCWPTSDLWPVPSAFLLAIHHHTATDFKGALK